MVKKCITKAWRRCGAMLTERGKPLKKWSHVNCAVHEAVDAGGGLRAGRSLDR